MRRLHPLTRLHIVLLTLAGLLVAVPLALAEMPQFRASSMPSIVHDGSPAVGETIRGDKGNLFYDNGTTCQSECRLTFDFYRLVGLSWVLVQSRPYVTDADASYLVQPGDAGNRLMFKVRAVKFDCGATNTQTGQTECHDVFREADSALTPVVAGDVVPPPAPPAVDYRAKALAVLRERLGQWRAAGVPFSHTRIFRACVELRLSTEPSC